MKLGNSVRCHAWDWSNRSSRRNKPLLVIRPASHNWLEGQRTIRDKLQKYVTRNNLKHSRKFYESDFKQITVTSVVAVTWKTSLLLQARWHCSSSCSSPLARCVVYAEEYVRTTSGCSCWVGTDWRGPQYAAHCMMSVAPACHPAAYPVASCRGCHTQSRCHGLRNVNTHKKNKTKVWCWNPNMLLIINK